MGTPIHGKSSVGKIRERFDADVERFSNLETGQTSTVDAALTLALACDAAAGATPHAKAVLDIGCGAGNYALSLLQRLPGLDVTLVDLSRPMLDRASERVGAATAGKVTTIQGDIREIEFGAGSVDIILAAAVLHHLRDESEWRDVFAKCHRALRPGGSFWIVDLVAHEIPAVESLMWSRYGDYLAAFKGPEYRDHVFAYIDKEDSQRSATFQIVTLLGAGFSKVDLLHKNTCFAAFGAVKAL